MRNNNNSGGLITLLTVLLASCIIAEAGIASYVGVTVQINQQPNEDAIARYEEYQEQRRQERDEPAAVDYVGPNVHVKDGQVVRGAMPGTATTRSVVAEPQPDPVPTQETEPQNEPEPAKELEAQPTTAPSEKPKAPAASTASSNQANANGGGTPSRETNADKFSAGKVLITTASNNNGKPVYHTKYCSSAQKIAQNDMYWYDSAEDAIADGRKLCGNCSR